MAANEVRFYQMSDRCWVTDRIYNFKSFTIELAKDGRFYLWADDIVGGRHLRGVFDTFAKARTEIQIHVQRGKKK